jgi:hypothetical protein
VIELGLMAGDAFETQPGLSESIELGLTTGDAFGGITGLHESIELVLDAGEAIGDVQVGGVAEAIELALITGPGSVASALGINEAVDLVLVGGAATEEGAGSTDPNFSSVSLLLHMDGGDGSTTFTDSSSNALTAAASGTAQVSTSVVKYGTGSANFNESSAGRLTVTGSSVLGFTGDFTIEFWAYRTGNRGTLDTMMEAGSSGGSFTIRASTSGPGVYFTGAFENYANTLSLTENTWHHIAVCRAGSTVYVFKDGVDITTNAAPLTAGINDFGGNPIRIGESEISGRAFKGYIDDVRITKGVARYTANFTPPTAPFPDS